LRKREKNIRLPEFFLRLRERVKALLKRFRQKHLVFLLFVGLATLAWYMRALSDTYVADIDYPVKYTNLPPNRMLSKEPPNKLKLRVQADGFTILSSRFKFKRPLSYNVNAFALYSLSADSTSVYTLTGYAKDRLSAELSLSGKNIQILDISPDTLIFNFSRLKKKKIPVKVILEDTPNMFEKQYMMNGKPYAVPDTLLVTGPSYIIDTLSHIYTQPFRVKNLSDTIEKKVLLSTINRITLPQKKIKVVVPVDEFTESQFDIPVQLRGVPDSLVVKTFPGTVQVKYIITLSQFNKVTPGQFHAYINYKTIDPELSTKLKVELDSVPTFLHNMSLTPRTVEFLIERKDVKNWADRGNR
jgi:hypothetical protein